MTLKLRLFLLFGGLMLVLMAAQWWLLRQLSARALEDFGAAAIAISRDMADFFSHEVETLQSSRIRLEKRKETDTAGGLVEKREIRVMERVQSGPVGTEAADAQLSASLAAEPNQTAETPDPEGPARVLFNTDITESGEQFVLNLQGPHAERQIRISSDQLDESTRRLSGQLLAGTLGLFVLGLALAAVLANNVARPMRRLASTAQRVAQGEFGAEVKVSGTSEEIRQAVSAFNRMSHQLSEYQAKIQRLEEERHLAELGEIARGLAHTIRNPLNALGLALDELNERRAPSDDQSERLIARAGLQIQRIDRWVRSLLLLTSHSSELLAELSLSDLARDVALELRQSGGCPVTVEEAPHTAKIKGIEAELRGMLQALLENAVEASGPEGQVEVRLDSPADGSVRISIQDQGPGLPEAVRDRLFAPHVTTKPHGAGMGLYLTERLARTRYGGALKVESPGHGTEAVLQLCDRTGSAS